MAEIREKRLPFGRLDRELDEPSNVVQTPAEKPSLAAVVLRFPFACRWEIV
jgi:hypothetical protein